MLRSGPLAQDSPRQTAGTVTPWEEIPIRRLTGVSQGPRNLVARRAEENLAGHRPVPEEAMWEQVGQLCAHHGDVPAEVRLLKLTEEVGEVAEAFIGMHGLNGRKGILD